MPAPFPLRSPLLSTTCLTALAILSNGVLIRLWRAFSAFVDYDAKLNKRETVHNVTVGLRLIW